MLSHDEPPMLFLTTTAELSLKSPLRADTSYDIRPRPVTSAAVTGSAGVNLRDELTQLPEYAFLFFEDTYTR